MSKRFKENYQLIDWSKPIELPRKRELPPARSDLGFPMIISDEMSPTQSMADGKVYDSKRAMAAATRAAGCIEVGNEKVQPYVRPRPDRKHIKQTIQKAVARYERGERVKKK